MKIVNPERRAMVRARVVRTERTTPNFVTVTLGGEELADFEYLGLDQCARLFLPREGQDRLRMPGGSGNGWIANYYLMPSAERPLFRNYTPRRFDPERLELDIEFAVHGAQAPASGWALHAKEGDEAGLFAEGYYYLPSPDADWQLLVGDESAVPALLSILEQAPADLRAQVYLEVPESADIREVAVPEGVDVHWLPRDGGGGVPGELALRTVLAADLPEGVPYCFVAGERTLPTALRRELVRERKVPKRHISFIGYWRHGTAAYK
ncbi:NADPH-dependent ferric siderophore reductase, contains FAD-binding and SIP domains [Nocardiopsis flavescens]|uniref:NADPH-dependent ferric siderophore reductase, contains FAD-binding and SIP domains n=2 Tax=Nocardiopsis flavescens TaxID=758803 RepID=A0A1M6WC10_9ACTN|nr:NADPH-dependent ferric siderophore reductase, contains FAD-binding and SIP domains [Nocardiopsis flavescens]